MRRTNRTSIEGRAQAQAIRRSSDGNDLDRYDLRRPSVIARLLKELGPTIPLTTGDPDCDFVLLSMQLDEENKDGSLSASLNEGYASMNDQAISSDEGESADEAMLPSSSDLDGKDNDLSNIALGCNEARRASAKTTGSSFSSIENHPS